MQEDRRKKGIRRSWQNILAKLQMGTMNLDTYEMLLSMGYGNGASAEALRQANNDLNLALEVTAMGFEPEMSRRALVKYNADVQKAIDELVNCGGSLPPPIPGNQSPSTSAGSSSNTPTEVNSDKKVKEEKEAIDRLVSDLPDDKEDYLDISLEEEKHFLQEYKALMLSLSL